MTLKDFLSRVRPEDRAKSKNNFSDYEKELNNKADKLIKGTDKLSSSEKIPLYLEALKIFAKTRQYYSMMLMGFFMSDCHLDMQQYEYARNGFELIIENCDSLNPNKDIEPFLEMEIHALLGMVDYYWRLDKMNEAKQTYISAMSLYSKIENLITKENLEHQMEEAQRMLMRPSLTIFQNKDGSIKDIKLKREKRK